MKVNAKRLRRGGALVGLTGAGVVVALGSASAYVGAPGTGTLPNATQAPDLKSATIVTTVQPADPGGPVVRFCFDRPLTAVNPALFFTNDYDSARGNRGVGTAQPDAQDTTCTNVTFATARTSSRARRASPKMAP